MMSRSSTVRSHPPEEREATEAEIDRPIQMDELEGDPLLLVPTREEEGEQDEEQEEDDGTLFPPPPPYSRFPLPPAATQATVIAPRKKICGRRFKIVAVVATLLCMLLVGSMLAGTLLLIRNSECSANKMLRKENFKTFLCSAVEGGDEEQHEPPEIELELVGAVHVRPSYGQPGLVETFLNITSVNQQTADSIQLDVKATDSSFEVELADFVWWDCPRIDALLCLDDSALYGSPELKVESDGGDISVDSFDNLVLSSLRLQTSRGSVVAKHLPEVTSSVLLKGADGDIVVDYLAAGSEAKLKTSNGAISVEIAVVANEMELETSSSPICLGRITCLRLSVETNNADISADFLELRQDSLSELAIGGDKRREEDGQKCCVELKTSNGQITVDELVFPSGDGELECAVDVKTSDGDVTLIVSNFSGIFDLATSSPGSLVVAVGAEGQAPCDDDNSLRCSGIFGSGRHTLTVRTRGANLHVTFQ